MACKICNTNNCTSHRLVSPGVFTKEKDSTFVQKGIQEMGVVVVGPTQKGPAYTPLTLTSYSEYETVFGNDTSNTYVPYTIQNYLKSGNNATVVRVLGNGGWKWEAGRIKAMVDSNNYITNVLTPSQTNNPDSLGLETSNLSPSNPLVNSGFILNLSGTNVPSQSFSSSLNSTSADYLPRVLGSNEANSIIGDCLYESTAYPYLNFSSQLSGSLSLISNNSDIEYLGQNPEGYAHSITPFITSQILSGNITKNLFRFHHLGDGDFTNKDIKISITNLVEPIDINEYTSFDVVVRRFTDTDENQDILEVHSNINLDPDSVNYISRRIGDQYTQYDADSCKLMTSGGEYTINSNYIRVEVAPGVKNKSYSPNLSPRGFKTLSQTIAGFTGYNLVPSKYNVSSSIDNPNSFFGWIFEGNLGKDNNNYLKAIPVSSSLSITSDFNIGNCVVTGSNLYTGSLSNLVDPLGITGPLPYQVQFTIPFQGGSDGIHPSIPKNHGCCISTSNMQGYDLSTNNSKGTLSYKKAFKILENQDEFDFNLLVTPGVIKQYHPSVISSGIGLVECRTDAFYILDITNCNSCVKTAQCLTSDLNSNFAATYYPWVKMMDTSKNKPTLVPPSVVIPEIFAQSDSLSAEWFAPAGLRRGGVGSAMEAGVKLSKSDRDCLYDNRINPIATFPQTGLSVWGQKTLQQRGSALDRINVRRLLIKVRKYVASMSRFLIFEPNTVITRNKFLSMINPYLESIKQKEGLYSFRVICDDTNNTNDVIDRNELVGQIYLQPTKAIEYILLDFQITPTGSTFGDATFKDTNN